MKFKVGDKVKTHIHGYREQGTILECINVNEPDDIKIQGYRYYVSLGRSKHIWSITEKWLQPIQQN